MLRATGYLVTLAYLGCVTLTLILLLLFIVLKRCQRCGGRNIGAATGNTRVLKTTRRHSWTLWTRYSALALHPRFRRTRVRLQSLPVIDIIFRA